jgi:polysaccharide export outer membrane protein
MKSVFMMWAALLWAALCLAQTPPAVQAPPNSPDKVTAPKVQKPPEAQGAPVVVPNTPFESGAAPASPASSPAGGVQQPPADTAATRSAAQPATASTTEGNTKAKKSYLIGPLDVLDIRVWNDQKLSGIFDVRPDGVISMNLIGEIQADGLTVAELTKAIVAKLSDLMNAPEVNVQVVRVNSKRYYIFGEVGRGGEFPLTADTTVLEALSTAGGFKEFANPKKIYVLRGTQKLKFNYKEVSQGKHMEQNIMLENGDKIFVP